MIVVYTCHTITAWLCDAYSSLPEREPPNCRTLGSVQLVARQMTGSQINTSVLRTSWPNLRNEDTCGILLYFR